MYRELGVNIAAVVDPSGMAVDVGVNGEGAVVGIKEETLVLVPLVVLFDLNVLKMKFSATSLTTSRFSGMGFLETT